MRYKHYLHLIKVHKRMHLRSPLVFFDVPYKSDTSMRLMRYIGSHNLNFDVRIYYREYDSPVISYEDCDYDPMSPVFWSD